MKLTLAVISKPRSLPSWLGPSCKNNIEIPNPKKHCLKGNFINIIIFSIINNEPRGQPGSSTMDPTKRREAGVTCVKDQTVRIARRPPPISQNWLYDYTQVEVNKAPSKQLIWATAARSLSVCLSLSLSRQREGYLQLPKLPVTERCLPWVEYHNPL